MQERHLFEYAVLRVIPRVEREEFINVGVIVYCPSQQFLRTTFALNRNRLTALCPKIDIEEINDRLMAFKSICEGDAGSGIIGQLPIASRFRWLTANRSTIVQTSPVHPGLCEDASVMLDRLFSQLVE